MNDYYTSIELGTNSIKILVCNKIGNSFNVIASIDSPSEGIKNGNVIDTRCAINATKKAIKKINEKLNIKLTKVIACVPTTNCKMDIVVGSITLDSDLRITGNEISDVINDSIKGQIREDEELITAIPISFKVDNRDNIKNPKGMSGEELGVKVLISKSPKELIYKVLEVLKLSGLDVVDIAYTSTGDYYEVRSDRLDKEVGAIINIGESSTNVSIFNKGIMIKNKIINVGSKNIDNDLTYIYKIDNKVSRNLKENFVVAISNYADNNEICEITTITGEKKEINQLEISKVVESRCAQILNLSKKEIKNLTKREISYIIITGGVSELAGFQYLTEDILGIKARVCNIATIGVRHNKYSSVLGLIKYIDNKLKLRDKSISMINEEDINALISISENNNNGNIINKVFGRFFEN